ncbi:MAG: hypothetical protein V5A23_09635 [Halobacteriales archaeon]
MSEEPSDGEARDDSPEAPNSGDDRPEGRAGTDGEPSDADGPPQQDESQNDESSRKDQSARNGDQEPPRHPSEGLDDDTRRWLIRILVGLGIGIPILIEGATFLELFRHHLLGSDTPTPTAATDTPGGVGVGGELLPGTPQTETLTDATLRAGDGAWSFEVAVAVENTGEVPYELRLGEVVTETGTMVDGSASTGQVPPGETATVEGTWALPSGSEPDRLAVVAVTYGETTATVSESVKLGSIPTQR